MRSGTLICLVLVAGCSSRTDGAGTTADEHESNQSAADRTEGTAEESNQSSPDATEQPNLPRRLPTERQRIDMLPSMGPVYGTPSVELMAAMDLARAFFDMGPPPPAPADPDPAVSQEWVENDIAPWIRTRAETAAEATNALGGLDQEIPIHQIVGPAVAGLVYLDMAAGLGQLSSPFNIRGDSELQAIYWDAIITQGAPYLIQAEQAFEACASRANETGGPWAEWATFCTERAAATRP